MDPANRHKCNLSDAMTLASKLQFTAEERENIEHEWLDYFAEELPVTHDPQSFWGAGSMLSEPNLTQFMRAVMAIPHSNASSERVFSMLK